MPSGGLAGTVGQKTENRKRTKLDLESGSPTKNRESHFMTLPIVKSTPVGSMD